jgi:deazaflavin-dependent oxidoreductase (nitroreductase family)
MQKVFSATHVFLYRASGGRIGGRFKKAPVLLLTTTGSKSGLERQTPLLYVQDGDALVVVASNGGADRAPSWYGNLRANPSAVARIGSDDRTVRARDANADERSRLWPKIVSAYPAYDDYVAKTTRQIPVVILDPTSGGGS